MGVGFRAAVLAGGGLWRWERVIDKAAWQGTLPGVGNGKGAAYEMTLAGADAGNVGVILCSHIHAKLNPMITIKPFTILG